MDSGSLLRRFARSPLQGQLPAWSPMRSLTASHKGQAVSAWAWATGSRSRIWTTTLSCTTWGQHASPTERMQPSASPQLLEKLQVCAESCTAFVGRVKLLQRGPVQRLRQRLLFQVGWQWNRDTVNLTVECSQRGVNGNAVGGVEEPAGGFVGGPRPHC